MPLIRQTMTNGNYSVAWSTETDRLKFIQAFLLKRRQQRPLSSREFYLPIITLPSKWIKRNELEKIAPLPNNSIVYNGIGLLSHSCTKISFHDVPDVINRRSYRRSKSGWDLFIERIEIRTEFTQIDVHLMQSCFDRRVDRRKLHFILPLSYSWYFTRNVNDFFSVF